MFCIKKKNEETPYTKAHGGEISKLAKCSVNFAGECMKAEWTAVLNLPIGLFLIPTYLIFYKKSRTDPFLNQIYCSSKLWKAESNNSPLGRLGDFPTL